MTTEPPNLSITRVFDAPRALVYRAFTDPEQLAAWWGPTGSVRPLDEMDFDVRPGGFQRFVQVFPDDPSIRAEVHIDLTEVAEGRVLDGVMRVGGRLPGDFEHGFDWDATSQPDPNIAEFIGCRATQTKETSR